MVCTFGGKEMNNNSNNPFINGGFKYSTEPTHICHLKLEILTNDYSPEWLIEAANKYDDFDTRISLICQYSVMRYEPVITLSAVSEERRDTGKLVIEYDIIAGANGFSGYKRNKIIDEFRMVAYNLATHVNTMIVKLQIDGRNEFYHL